MVAIDVDEALNIYLQHPDVAVRRAILEQATRAEYTTWPTPLKELFFAAINDPDRRVRNTAAWGLGQLGGESALEALHGLLTDPSPSMRAHAANGLSHLYHRTPLPDAMQRARTVQVLQQGLSDRDPAVRRYMATALPSVRGHWRTVGVDEVAHAAIEATLREYQERFPADRAFRIPPPEIILQQAAPSELRLPVPLERAHQRARSAMVSHPIHHLVPLLRSAIYDALESGGDARASRARVLLGTWAARRVLHIFEEGCEWPELFAGEAREALLLAEDVYFGLACRGEAETFLYQTGGGPGPDAGRAGDAARMAAHFALADRTNLDLVWGETTTDEEEPLGYDAAGCAACAEAGEARSRRLSPPRLRTYWEWWLDTALLAAWFESRTAVEPM